jgi:hypothetical protein
VCYKPRLSHPPWLDHSNYTWPTSPTSYHFIFLWSKYSPQDPVITIRRRWFADEGPTLGAKKYFYNRSSVIRRQ